MSGAQNVQFVFVSPTNWGTSNIERRTLNVERNSPCALKIPHPNPFLRWGGEEIAGVGEILEGPL
jgi:hypothetical protein